MGEVWENLMEMNNELVAMNREEHAIELEHGVLRTQWGDNMESTKLKRVW